MVIVMGEGCDERELQDLLSRPGPLPAWSARTRDVDILERSRWEGDVMRWRGTYSRGWRNNDTIILVTALLVVLMPPAHAAFIDFANCLDQAIVQPNSFLQLQFVPLFVSAKFDPSTDPYPLDVTVYGNVSGLVTKQDYPAPDDPQWTNSNDTVGKIVNVSEATEVFSTLFTTLNVLTYTPYSAHSSFCASVVQGQCPLGPVFYANSSDPAQLRAFSIRHNMTSSYRFSSIATTLLLKSGDSPALELACISTTITPGLGTTFQGLLGFMPLVILVLVGFATAFAAIYSPWGSTDPFRWTSNYGRDEDLLRLVTPGFTDCLQYIQFVVLTGALSLNYPGFYQPAVSQASWSVLMFNHSFVSGGGGRDPVVDGIYAVNATYGLDGLSQLVGMEAVYDIWSGMVIWLLVMIGSITGLTQLGLALGWIYRRMANVAQEDLRTLNLPFTIGNIIRVVFNYFLLPTVSLSMFQLVVAGQSPAYTAGLAVVLILVLILFTAWLIRLIVNTRPKSYLFDDLSTVLLYGPLYNTFCDDAAAFALVSILITFMRGVAIGALQPSGIAQLVLLAICEVVFALTLSAFRPFPSATSMNIYHFGFAAVRFLVVLLSVTFVPSLDIPEEARGWIGYIILLVHAIILVFGFFLNALQTIVEVTARLAGAGGYGTSATRGGLTKVFGMRQLSRRVARVDHTARQSMNSEAAMLANMEDHEIRPRSLSGSSALLLGRTAASEGRTSGAYEAGSAQGGHSRANSSGLYTPTTPGAGSAFSQTPGYQAMVAGTPKSGSIAALKPSEPYDPYYRPPRTRRMTMEVRSSADITPAKFERSSRPVEETPERQSGTPIPAYLGLAGREDIDLDETRTRKDYAVREVDFYYRVRGPALSHMGTRRLKTGPADPTSPVSSATGWFRRFFGGKTKEKGKGFEVVRSARAPPPSLLRPTEGEEFHEPYRDDPDAQGSEDTGNESATSGHSRRVSGAGILYRDCDGEDHAPRRIKEALVLPEVDPGGAIELPSRLGSRTSSRDGPRAAAAESPPPPIPRRSSRRQSSIDSRDGISKRSLVLPPRETGWKDNNGEPGPTLLQPSDAHPGRLPFGTTSSTNQDRTASTASTTSSFQRGSSDDHGYYAADTRHDRPSSMGYVSQHRAGANIHEASPSGVPLAGSAAELVETTHSDSD